MDEAVRRGSRLRVIAVVQLPEYGVTSFAKLVPPPPDELVEDVRKATQQHVDELVAGAPESSAACRSASRPESADPGRCCATPLTVLICWSSDTAVVARWRAG
jgi:uncharacterized radical SAM superfamily protein